jgi:hypothetical protein
MSQHRNFLIPVHRLLGLAQRLLMNLWSRSSAARPPDSKRRELMDHHHVAASKCFGTGRLHRSSGGEHVLLNYSRERTEEKECVSNAQLRCECFGLFRRRDTPAAHPHPQHSLFAVTTPSITIPVLRTCAA